MVLQKQYKKNNKNKDNRFLGAIMAPMVPPIDSNYGLFIDTNHDFFSGKRYY